MSYSFIRSFLFFFFFFPLTPPPPPLHLSDTYEPIFFHFFDFSSVFLFFYFSCYSFHLFKNLFFSYYFSSISSFFFIFFDNFSIPRRVYFQKETNYKASRWMKWEEIKGKLKSSARMRSSISKRFPGKSDETSTGRTIKFHFILFFISKMAETDIKWMNFIREFRICDRLEMIRSLEIIRSVEDAPLFLLHFPGKFFFVAVLSLNDELLMIRSAFAGRPLQHESDS